jgi:hypothetical protein
MPTMQVGETVESQPAPVVENPAMPNEDIDMGITSVESGDNDGSNNTLGGFDPMIIVGAVAIVAFLMR